ncbi:unnamed protein product [Cuscuta campestris]|uniref:Retrotransposon gag domain-containing protein n=1 Tax=Cuscuta campestris TaxID=132261 RepID=A0A484N3X2_9ASTE|nr:unnamed protein product [Cuscuta campestris]
MSHEELVAANATLQAQVEYLAKEVAKLTKQKMSMLRDSEDEEEASSSVTMRTRAHEKSHSDFKVDIPIFEGKNDPDEFLEDDASTSSTNKAKTNDGSDFKDHSHASKSKLFKLKLHPLSSSKSTARIHTPSHPLSISTMSNESRTMSHEELIASNTALKAQVEYLDKEVAKLTKMKLNELQGSDREEDVSSSGTMKPKANEGSDFKVDIPTFEGKNDPNEFLEWLETVERVFDFKDVSHKKKVKIVALKFRKYASTWWTNTCTKRRRNDKEPVSTWVKMRSLLKKKFLPAEYVRENFAKLQTLRQGSKSVEEYNREFEELLLRYDLQEDDEQTFVRYLFSLNLQIANTVELQSYDSLEELTKLALKVEAQHKKSKAFFSKNNTPSPRPYFSTPKPPYPSPKLPYTTPRNPTTAHGPNPSSSTPSTSRNPSSSFTPRADPTKKAPVCFRCQGQGSSFGLERASEKVKSTFGPKINEIGPRSRNSREAQRTKASRCPTWTLGQVGRLELDALARLQTKEDTWQNLVGRSSSSVPIWTPGLGRFDLDTSASVL